MADQIRPEDAPETIERRKLDALVEAAIMDNGTVVISSAERAVEAVLSPEQAYTLLDLLYNHRDMLHKHSAEKLLEIRLYQKDLAHLDELKAAIPDIHEHGPAIKVLDVRWDKVTERALELLKELQLEYIVHPLLEDHDLFAQG